MLLIGFAIEGALPAHAERFKVTLNEGYEIGRTAFLQKNYALAYSISAQLLQATPDSVPALVLMAASAPQVGKPKEGLSAARRAFSKSETSAQKREIAVYGAIAAAQSKRALSTQLWLRRAYQHSTTQEQRASIASQYRKYSRISPVRLSFSATVSPSSNLNGGAEDRYLVIDGVAPIGILSGSAQALSGIRATVNGQLTYTLSESPTHKTTVSAFARVSKVDLSSEAKRLAPDVSSKDLNDTQIAARLTHQIAHKDRPIPDTYSLAFGQTWFGGDKYSNYGSLSVGRQFKLGAQTLLQTGLDYTHQTFEGDDRDKDITTLRFGLVHRLPTQDIFRLGLKFSESGSDDINSDFRSIGADIGYQFAKPIGPFTITTSLQYDETEYESYRIGFIPVPGGRKDKTTRLKLSLAFEDFSYFGFVPKLNVGHVKTKSNISRFVSNSTGVGFSFVSSF